MIYIYIYFYNYLYLYYSTHIWLIIDGKLVAKYTRHGSYAVLIPSFGLLIDSFRPKNSPHAAVGLDFLHGENFLGGMWWRVEIQKSLKSKMKKSNFL